MTSASDRFLGIVNEEVLDSRPPPAQEEETDNQCCFPDCSNDIGEYGYNPAPLMQWGRCCTACNFGRVYRARMSAYLSPDVAQEVLEAIRELERQMAEGLLLLPYPYPLSDETPVFVRNNPGYSGGDPMGPFGPSSTYWVLAEDGREIRLPRRPWPRPWATEFVCVECGEDTHVTQAHFADPSDPKYARTGINFENHTYRFCSEKCVEEHNPWRGHCFRRT